MCFNAFVIATLHQHQTVIVCAFKAVNWKKTCNDDDDDDNYSTLVGL